MGESGDSGDIGECSIHEGAIVGLPGGVVPEVDGLSAFFGGSLNSYLSHEHFDLVVVQLGTPDLPSRLSLS